MTIPILYTVILLLSMALLIGGYYFMDQRREKTSSQAKVRDLEAENVILWAKIREWNQYNGKVEARMIYAEAECAGLASLNENIRKEVEILDSENEALWAVVVREGNARAAKQILEQALEMIKKLGPGLA